MERAAGPRRRRGRGGRPARAARAAAHGTHPGVRRHRVPRGGGQVGAQPGAGQLAGAVPLDGQPVPRLLARLRLLPRPATPGSCWPTGAPGRSPSCGWATPCWAPSWSPGSAATCAPRCWRTGPPSKPAYRVRLAGGTELTASGEHRFLTARGWRHVTGGWCRSGRRPRLRVGDVLLGPGPFGPTPASHTAGYRRGYLCGVVRGDEEPAAGRSFPSAELELEALGRAHHFLAAAGRARRARARSAGPGRVGLRVAGRDRAGADRPAAGPRRRGRHVDRRRGALAGPAGRRLVCRLPGRAGRRPRRGTVRGELRIRHPDDEVLGPGGRGAAPARVPVPGRGRRAAAVRSGCSAGCRSSCASCSWSTRRCRGGATWAAPRSAVAAALAVQSVAAGRASSGCTTSPPAPATSWPRASSATTASPATPTPTWTSTPAPTSTARSWSRSTSARVLERELRSPRWAREPVAMGTNTDPYQRAEGRYRLMPG